MRLGSVCSIKPYDAYREGISSCTCSCVCMLHARHGCCSAQRRQAGQTSHASVGGDGGQAIPPPIHTHTGPCLRCCLRLPLMRAWAWRVCAGRRWTAIQSSGQLLRMKRTHIHFATSPHHMRKNNWACVYLRLKAKVRVRACARVPVTACSQAGAAGLSPRRHRNTSMQHTTMQCNPQRCLLPLPRAVPASPVFCRGTRQAPARPPASLHATLPSQPVSQQLMP